MPDALDADVVVIGAGPVGAAAAWRLASQGVDVLCLERGRWIAPETLGFGDPDYEARRAAVLHENPNVRRGPDDDPVDDSDSPIKVAIGNAVGGGSIWWAAHIPRYRPGDFRVLALDGVAADWPIGYDDLAPYYTINEAMMGLAAVAGDPAGPPRAAVPLPMPTIGPAGRRMARAFDGLGWHWWPVDLAVGPGDDMPRCTHAGPCGPGCPARVRAGADATYMRPALAAGARLATRIRVTALACDASGAVTAAICATDDGTVRVTGRYFMLAANGLGTPRLLLMSASGAAPGGLANRSGLVGRNLMLHPHARVDGLFASRWAVGRRARQRGWCAWSFCAPTPPAAFCAGSRCSSRRLAGRRRRPGPARWAAPCPGGRAIMPPMPRGSTTWRA